MDRKGYDRKIALSAEHVWVYSCNISARLFIETVLFSLHCITHTSSDISEIVLFSQWSASIFLEQAFEVSP